MIHGVEAANKSLLSVVAELIKAELVFAVLALSAFCTVQADTLINFDSLPAAGTPVGNSLASSGVLFSHQFSIENFNGAGVSIPSGANYITVNAAATLATPGIAQFVSPADASIPAVTQYVQFDINGLSSGNGWYNGFTVSALDFFGNTLATATVNPIGPNVGRSISTVTLTAPNIHSLAFVIIPNSNGGNALAPSDNWQFGTLTIVPEPGTLGLLGLGVVLILRRHRRANA